MILARNALGIVTLALFQQLRHSFVPCLNAKAEMLTVMTFDY